LTETNTGFLAGPVLSYADIIWYTTIDAWRDLKVEFDFSAYPKTKTLFETIDNHPRVKHWNSTVNKK